MNINKLLIMCVGVCAVWPAAGKTTSRGGGVAIYTTTAASRIIPASSP